MGQGVVTAKAIGLAFGHLVDSDARGIGGHQASGLGVSGDDLVDLVFDLDVFKDGLDDPIHLTEKRMILRGIVHGNNPPRSGHTTQVVLDGSGHGLLSVTGKIKEGDGKALVTQIAGNLPTHNAGTEDGDFLGRKS